MPEDARGIDDDRFDRWRPDLEHLTSLDLNWRHGLNVEGRNFGRAYLYSIGNTGHRYVCACVIPGVAPQDYPIAIVDEEGYDCEVIAGSIRTWLPAYVARRAADLERHAAGYARERAAWRAEEPAIRDALERFGAGPTPPDGYAGYNRALYRDYKSSPALAYEVFRRRTHLDARGVQAWDVVQDAARIVLAAGHPVEEPLAPLVATVAEHGFGSWLWGDSFGAAGRRWLAAGDVEQALVCFENAVNYYDAEAEEWHRDSVLAIRGIDHADPNYAYYVDDFLPQEGDLEDEDEDD